MHGGLSFSLFYVLLSLFVTLSFYLVLSLSTVSVEHFLWVLVPFCENIILLQELGMCT